MSNNNNQKAATSCPGINPKGDRGRVVNRLENQKTDSHKLSDKKASPRGQIQGRSDPPALQHGGPRGSSKQRGGDDDDLVGKRVRVILNGTAIQHPRKKNKFFIHWKDMAKVYTREEIENFEFIESSEEFESKQADKKKPACNGNGDDDDDEEFVVGADRISKVDEDGEDSMNEESV